MKLLDAHLFLRKLRNLTPEEEKQLCIEYEQNSVPDKSFNLSEISVDLMNAKEGLLISGKIFDSSEEGERLFEYQMDVLKKVRRTETPNINHFVAAVKCGSNKLLIQDSPYAALVNRQGAVIASKDIISLRQVPQDEINNVLLQIFCTFYMLQKKDIKCDLHFYNIVVCVLPVKEYLEYTIEKAEFCCKTNYIAKLSGWEDPDISLTYDQILYVFARSIQINARFHLEKLSTLYGSVKTIGAKKEVDFIERLVDLTPTQRSYIESKQVVFNDKREPVYYLTAAELKEGLDYATRKVGLTVRLTDKNFAILFTDYNPEFPNTLPNIFDALSTIRLDCRDKTTPKLKFKFIPLDKLGEDNFYEDIYPRPAPRPTVLRESMPVVRETPQPEFRPLPSFDEEMVEFRPMPSLDEDMSGPLLERYYADGEPIKEIDFMKD